ncbi:unnamed protein product [Haemonchus placei]|uniref:DUF4238 domain-containing protein n=1 Tax=Haemonchus placei TaxID=6290 RepID=A0A0N4VTC2_HAEPC|nr:unnamed protein product [Haemonchus placei]
MINAEESVGIDTTMEHSESGPTPLNDWDNVGEDIPNKNRKAGVIPEELRRVIEEYSDVFAVSDKELTQTNLVTHDLMWAHDWLLELREDPDFATLITSMESRVMEDGKLSRHNKVLSTADFALQNGSLSLINENGSLAAVVPRSQRRNIHWCAKLRDESNFRFLYLFQTTGLDEIYTVPIEDHYGIAQEADGRKTK